MQIQSSATMQYKETQKLSPEQKNNASDALYMKKEDTKDNLNDIQNQKNAFKADMYTYKTKQSQLDIYMDVATEENKNVSNEKDININVEIDKQNGIVGDKEPYNKINPYDSVNEYA
jgi:hypothetical protein